MPVPRRQPRYGAGINTDPTARPDVPAIKCPRNSGNSSEVRAGERAQRLAAMSLLCAHTAAWAPLRTPSRAAFRCAPCLAGATSPRLPTASRSRSPGPAPEPQETASRENKAIRCREDARRIAQNYRNAGGAVAARERREAAGRPTAPRSGRPRCAPNAARLIERRPPAQGLRTSSARMMPMGIAAARTARTSIRRNCRAMGATAGRIHRAGTSRNAGHRRRPQTMSRSSSQLSIAAPGPLGITRRYALASSSAKHANPRP